MEPEVLFLWSEQGKLSNGLGGSGDDAVQQDLEMGQQPLHRCLLKQVGIIFYLAM